jgi:hypothetical protein
MKWVMKQDKLFDFVLTHGKVQYALYGHGNSYCHILTSVWKFWAAENIVYLKGTKEIVNLLFYIRGTVWSVQVD